MAEHGRSRENEAERRDIVQLSKLRSQHCAATALGEGLAQSRTELEVALRHAGNAVSTDLTPHSRGAASRSLETTAREARLLTVLEAGNKMAFTNLFITVAVMAGAFLSSDLSQKTSLHLLLVRLSSFYRQGNNCRKLLSFSDMSYHGSHSL